MEMDKLKTTLNFDALRATQQKPPSIPFLRIMDIDQGSPIRKDNGLLAPKLVIPISEVFVTPSAQPFIQCIHGPPNKEKGKGISFEPISLMKSSKNYEGWPHH